MSNNRAIAEAIFSSFGVSSSPESRNWIHDCVAFFDGNTLLNQQQDFESFILQNILFSSIQDFSRAGHQDLYQRLKRTSETGIPEKVVNSAGAYFMMEIQSIQNVSMSLMALVETIEAHQDLEKLPSIPNQILKLSLCDGVYTYPALYTPSDTPHHQGLNLFSPLGTKLLIQSVNISNGCLRLDDKECKFYNLQGHVDRFDTKQPLHRVLDEARMKLGLPPSKKFNSTPQPTINSVKTKNESIVQQPIHQNNIPLNSQIMVPEKNEFSEDEYDHGLNSDDFRDVMTNIRGEESFMVESQEFGLDPLPPALPEDEQSHRGGERLEITNEDYLFSGNSVKEQDENKEKEYDSDDVCIVGPKTHTRAIVQSSSFSDEENGRAIQLKRKRSIVESIADFSRIPTNQSTNSSVLVWARIGEVGKLSKDPHGQFLHLVTLKDKSSTSLQVCICSLLIGNELGIKTPDAVTNMRAVDTDYVSKIMKKYMRKVKSLDGVVSLKIGPDYPIPVVESFPE